MVWDSLSTTGQSYYLTNKSLSDTLDKSLRYGQGFTLAQIVDIEGNVKGWQRISDNGDKKFTYGLEKTGSFILLGQEHFSFHRFLCLKLLPPKEEAIKKL